MGVIDKVHQWNYLLARQKETAHLLMAMDAYAIPNRTGFDKERNAGYHNSATSEYREKYSDQG